MSSVPVIICLSRQFDRTACRVSLGMRGFQRGKDFLICEWPDFVEGYLLREGMQMLVIDQIYGSKQAADDFVSRLKKRNSLLEAYWFTNSGWKHRPYDGFLIRREGSDPFRDVSNEVGDFLQRKKEGNSRIQQSTSLAWTAH